MKWYCEQAISLNMQRGTSRYIYLEKANSEQLHENPTDFEMMEPKGLKCKAQILGPQYSVTGRRRGKEEKSKDVLIHR